MCYKKDNANTQPTEDRPYRTEHMKDAPKQPTEKSAENLPKSLPKHFIVDHRYKYDRNGVTDWTPHFCLLCVMGLLFE